MKKLIVSVAEGDLSQESGLGRVLCHWQEAFVRRGYDFIHLGPSQVGSVLHPALFPYAAWRAYRRSGRKASVFLVHEPAAGVFANRGVPTVLVSHGIERRGWQIAQQENQRTHHPIPWRTRWLFPLWRLRFCDRGLRESDVLMLLNQEDVDFVHGTYRRANTAIYLFRNGVNPWDVDEKSPPAGPVTALFMGSWVERKGIRILAEAAGRLSEQNTALRWVLAGTGKPRDQVLREWPSPLQASTEVIPHFPLSAEKDLLARCHLFVLPSWFEGQPLSLLQAMACGRCCITTACCGQKDLIEHGNEGLLIAPGDTEGLVRSLQTCAQDASERLRLGKNARLKVADRTWDRVSEEVVNRIEALLQTASSPVEESGRDR